MSSPNVPKPEPTAEPNESFDQIFSQYEKSHSRKADGSAKQLVGTVIAITSDSVLLDIGFKTEGILPLSLFQAADETVKAGDRIPVAVKGRDPEGYYELVRGRVERPKDWSALEKAFAEKTVIMGTVTGAVKGGLSVDVGVRAFMPASRSGVRDSAELEKLVGQEIRCRIIKLDVAEEDLVVDRRAVAEEEERATKERRYSEVAVGQVVSGTVRSLTDYGAFVDLGGVDALLHVGDMAWARISKPSDLLTVGQAVDVKVLKVASEAEKRRISVGMKQLQPDPWDTAAAKYKAGERVRGTVTRLMDFGAFVALEAGLEGLIHISEMSWAKKVRTPSDIVKPGETVEVVILGVNAGERKLSLGLKQTLGDPWAEIAEKFPEGSVIEGPVTSIMKFGAFVQLAEGVEGMIHVSEISAEKRIEHPQDVLKVGQVVRAQVLAVDKEKRQLRLSMKQLVPTGLDEYIAEHKEGDVVSGRMMDVKGDRGRVELGEGIQASCRMTNESPAKQARVPETGKAAKADLSSLGSMLQARWKSGGSSSEAKAEPVRAGQIRQFKIVKLDATAKKIEVELA
jgi:small subunit ribosomal protein S1